MKTLHINPFNLKTTVKSYIRSKKPVKHVDIPLWIKDIGEDGNTFKKFYEMQRSLDYMATYNGINIVFGGVDDNIVFVTCQKGKRSETSDDITEQDEVADIARKIYATASKVL